MPDLNLDQIPTMSIGVAARLLGVSVSSIRQYESEGLLLLSRDENGRRLLSKEDAERVACIKSRVVDEGFNFEGLRRLLALIPCWEIRGCSEEERGRCPAFHNNTTPCWALKNSVCAEVGINCRECKVYQNASACSENFKEFLKATPYVTPATLSLITKE